MTLRCDCGGPVRLINDNGVTDPAHGDRWEEFECECCGETFTQVLSA